jgi:ATP-dependent Lon protease
MPCKGRLAITDQQGKIMRESAQIAPCFLSYKAAVLGINLDIFERNEVHYMYRRVKFPKTAPRRELP